MAASSVSFICASELQGSVNFSLDKSLHHIRNLLNGEKLRKGKLAPIFHTLHQATLNTTSHHCLDENQVTNSGTLAEDKHFGVFADPAGANIVG